MINKSLTADYLKRSEARLAAIEVLIRRSSWADVVRESQEVVELALKAALRSANIECPRIHDVGDILLTNAARMPIAAPELERLAEISRSLRRDRELSFYGSEDLTPSEFYRESDARKAFTDAQWTVQTVQRAVEKS